MGQLEFIINDTKLSSQGNFSGQSRFKFELNGDTNKYKNCKMVAVFERNREEYAIPMKEDCSYESHLRLNGYQAFNFGYNGMPYGTDTNNNKGIVQQFIESGTDISGIDSAVLAGGLNDVARWYSKTLAPGDINDYTYETLKDWVYKYDNTIDAIISLIVYIKRNAPHARIVLCNTIPSIATPYREFSTLKKFDSIIDDISILCGVTKCDLMRNMQITENVNNNNMAYDEHTHLNNNGYIAMANAIIAKVNELSNGTGNFVRWFDLNDDVITE